MPNAELLQRVIYHQFFLTGDILSDCDQNVCRKIFYLTVRGCDAQNSSQISGWLRFSLKKRDVFIEYEVFCGEIGCGENNQ
jgi:hypothetical protein